ncbi:MAG: hypothetical protein DBP02_17945 [gamma proteobacterium symbiont of Ctena orbiculata]|nr:MAG: hypothetical protein DBP02_17945 [gamma proteobacterium symbiont of Ctena orbiculata]
MRVIPLETKANAQVFLQDHNGTRMLGPVNTNPMHPVVPEKAPIKAHPKGTSFGARGEKFGYSK